MGSPKLIICRGLPASGKSTFAKQFQEGNPDVIRVNRDDLRAMLHGGVWSGENEKVIVNLEQIIAQDGLESGCTVIIDDTNLHPKTMTMWQQFAETRKLPWEVKDFTDVPYAICMARNDCRKNPVPMAAMKRMQRLLQAEKEATRHKYLPHDPNLRDAVMCDLDGTIAIHHGRNPYDASTCYDDWVNEPVRFVLHAIIASRTDSPRVIFMSARDDQWFTETKRWLIEIAGFKDFDLFMRKTGDKRQDAIVKRELWEAHVKGRFNVLVCLDDRDAVVVLWRSLGIPTMQVADGSF